MLKAINRPERRTEWDELLVGHILPAHCLRSCNVIVLYVKSNTGLSKKMDGIWNRYNLKSTGRIYTFGDLKCSEEFKVLDLP